MDRDTAAMSAPGRLGWPAALASSALATAVALGLMFLARSAYQIRTLPERVMEWLLLFIPPDQFEKGLQTFGTAAKEIALVGAYIGMAAALLVLGAWAVRRGPLTVVLTGVGLWLFAMAVVMPITGAGFFATKLLHDVALTNLSYLGLALAYSAVLLLTQLVRARAAAPAAPNELVASRRAFVGGLAGTVIAYGLTLWFGRSAGQIVGSLPAADVSTLKLPTPRPTGAATTVPSAAPTAPTAAPAAPTAKPAVSAGTVAPTLAPTAVVPPTPTAAPTKSPAEGGELPPAPKLVRQISRDKDGSLTNTGRAPGELAALITPNMRFYITTKNAGGDPVVDRDSWRLLLEGELNSPVQLDLRTLYKLPSVEVAKSLECISNWVTRCEEVPFGCDLVSTARWKGARLSDVLALAGGLKEGVQSIAVLSTDEFSASIPSDAALLEETLLVYEMNGEVLPIEHGYPARLLIPGRYGMKNPKWVASIRPMKEVYQDWYGQRGWSKDGIIRTMTRIDVPANGASLPPGEQQIAGIAYAGDRGIAKVEFSADGGKTWHEAKFIEPSLGKDTLVRWEGTFSLSPGAALQLAARSVDGTGAKQIEEFTPTQPDGGSGLHSIEVKAAA